MCAKAHFPHAGHDCLKLKGVPADQGHSDYINQSY